MSDVIRPEWGPPGDADTSHSPAGSGQGTGVTRARWRGGQIPGKASEGQAGRKEGPEKGAGGAGAPLSPSPTPSIAGWSWAVRRAVGGWSPHTVASFQVRGSGAKTRWCCRDRGRAEQEAGSPRTQTGPPLLMVTSDPVGGTIKPQKGGDKQRDSLSEPDTKPGNLKENGLIRLHSVFKMPNTTKAAELPSGAPLLLSPRPQAHHLHLPLPLRAPRPCLCHCNLSPEPVSSAHVLPSSVSEEERQQKAPEPPGKTTLEHRAGGQTHLRLHDQSKPPKLCCKL